MPTTGFLLSNFPWLYGNMYCLLSGVPDLWHRSKILRCGDLCHPHVLACIWVSFYFVWFVFIHHNFQFYFELYTYCNILDICLLLNCVNYLLFYMKLLSYLFCNMFGSVLECYELTGVSLLWTRRALANKAKIGLVWKQGKSEGFESCDRPIVRKRPIWVKIGDVLSCVTLKFDGWPWKTIGHLSFAVSSFVQHFIAIGEFKLELLSGNAQFG